MKLDPSKLRAARQAKGLSQAKLGEQLTGKRQNASQSIQGLESGFRGASADRIARLALILGVTAAELCEAEHA